MSGSKVEILCSPNHDDKFIIFGQDLSLYKVDQLKEGVPIKSQALKISDESYATLLTNNTDNQYAKCAAWYPGTNPDHLVAVGLANGKVVLSGFGKSGANDPKGLTGKEFIPRHNRQCNCLAWNPVTTNILAAGFDKNRADNSVLIWDVERSALDHHLTHSDRKQDISTPHRAIYELGQAEQTYSLAWFNSNSRTLATSISNKSIRIFDLREIVRPQSFTHTKAVYGICVDPHSEYRLASYVDSQVSIWDTRNFDKPVITLPENRPIIKLAWAPTRSGVLGVLCRDSPCIKLHDIQQCVGTDDIEPAVVERIVQPHVQLTVASFDWYHNQENRMLTITPTGTVKDVRIFERIAVDWSPNVYLSWACGQNIMHGNTASLKVDGNTAASLGGAEEDICVKMKRRAQRGYGLETDRLRENGVRAGDGKQLRRVWAWLDYVKGLTQVEEKSRRKSASNRYIGVKAILKGEVPVSTGTGPGPGPGSQLLRSESHQLPWQQSSDSPRQREPLSRRVYKSDLRAKALQLCGWSYEMTALGFALDRLEAEGEFERAAAIALFNLQMRRAIQALNNGAARVQGEKRVNLNIIAMALSGFTDEKNSLWKEMCANHSRELLHPYLRAMFDFLTTDSEFYNEVLDESSELEVIDKVAFACLYLPDTKLAEYTDRLTADLVMKGNLDGLLLTGLCRESLDLLANYVDATGDIQTASFIAIQGFPNADIVRDSRVHVWIDSYRELLDTWRMWHQRAEFDIVRNSADANLRISTQVFVSCNFCGKPIAYNMLASRNRHFMFGATTAHKPKISCCPGCRKPLPRCALCLINMGTASGTPFRPLNVENSLERSKKLSRFSDWFTWCQTCRHGGHSQHMSMWFREHSECPVTGCTCKCTTLDGVGGVLSSPGGVAVR